MSDVSIRYNGPKTVDEARLRNTMATRAGQPYSTEKLDKDIKSLYETGLVDDVRWLAEPDGGNVKLIAEVTTRPALVGVGFVGNTVFSDKKLAAETKLEAGSSLSDEQILAARRNIEKYYEGYGYSDVVVTHRMQDSGQSGAAELIFVIDEGMKGEVRKIRFEGNNHFDGETLRKEMKTKEKGWLSFLTKSGRIQGDQLNEDLEAILDFYRNAGYLRVSSPGIRREAVEGGKMDLVIPINEGEKYEVAGVGFGKMTVFKPEELYPSLTLVGGQGYSAKKMRADITTIRDYYGSKGYADAAVTPDIRNAGPNKVTITYRINEGRRYSVGRVNIAGNVKTQDKVIRREIPLKPGDPFNSVEMETTQKRLQNLNYFSQVDASGTPGGSGYRDLNVQVEEKKTGSVSFGLGFSSIDSIVGYVNLEQTNFDLFNPWKFTGGGQRFSTNLRVGSERTDFRISLVEPWFLDQKLSLGGDLYYQSARYLSDVYDQTNAGGSIFLRKPIGEKSFIKGDYRLESIEIDVDSDVTPASLFYDQDGDHIRSALGLEYVYDSRDALVNPRHGHKVEAGVVFSGGPIGGDVDTYSINLNGIKNWNFFYDTILTVSGQLSTVDAHSGEEVPVFDRLALGGARNLRGFEFRDVGPRDAETNEVFGGQTLGFMSVEYTVPVIESVRGAVFYDMGFVNEDSWDFSPSDLYNDVGIGVRLNLPFGPLALDYAIPLESPDNEADQGGQFNFSLNYQF